MMSESLPIVYLARHGETAWSLSGQHTGLTDLPLTERGERNARSLGERLRGLTFPKVFTSPLVRAARTCELAGFGGAAEVDYEGRRTGEIHAQRPDWQLFRDGCPGGDAGDGGRSESPALLFSFASQAAVFLASACLFLLGKPAAASLSSPATIPFLGSDGATYPAKVGPDGAYRVRVRVGEARVLLSCIDEARMVEHLQELSDFTRGAKTGAAPESRSFSLIPEKYAAWGTSGLKVSIRGGKNTHDFDLP
jgi:hypothetical protein